MNKLQLILVVAIAALVSSCGTMKSGVFGKQFDLESTKWQMVELNDEEVEAEDASYTLYFMEDNNLAGVGACNRIAGNYLQKRSTDLSLTLMASTRMMCPDMNMEAKFLFMLEAVDSYKVVRGELRLFKEKEVIARFKMIKE